MKESKSVERSNYTDVVKYMKEKTTGVQSQLDSRQLVNAALINRAITAKHNAEKSNQQSSSSVQQSEDLVKMAAAYSYNI